MKQMGFIYAIMFLLFGVGYEKEAQSEPWLGVRFAQHCAGCHAPGRKNLQPVDRRCSLSCQGCHVNPNGGGLRSFYGKWNEERIARTFKSKLFDQLRKPAPLPKQKYGNEAKAKRKLRNKRGKLKKGFPLVETNKEDLSEKRYDNKADYNYKKYAKSKKEYVFSIPKTDPYRQMEITKFDVGADIRTIYNNYTIKDGSGTRKSDNFFLMSADFGLQYRPFYRRYHLVYEARHLGGPGLKVTDLGKSGDLLTNNIKTRSLYVLVDDLPYNLFVMSGYYRPLFGNDTPDHTALAQKILTQVTDTSGGSYNIRYKASTIGVAPNVPYMNIHLIHKNMGGSTPLEDKTTGYGLNLGLRGVSYGWSTNYSYFRTEEKNKKIKVEMQAIVATFTIAKMVMVLELNAFTQDDPSDSFLKGGVKTLDLKYQLWRENYLTLEYATSNVTKNFKPGSSNQNKIGYRTFLFPGMDISLQYTTEKDQQTGSSAVTTSGLIGQLHTYF